MSQESKALESIGDLIVSIKNDLKEAHSITSKLVKRYSGNRTLGKANEYQGRIMGALDRILAIELSMRSKTTTLEGELEALGEIKEYLTKRMESDKASGRWEGVQAKGAE